MSHRVPRLLLGALLVLVTLAPISRASALEVGERAPEIGLRDLDGRMVRISSFRGRVLIVDVWAHWCGPCAEEMPTLQRLYARYRRRGLRVVGVSVDNQEAEARQFVERTHVRFQNVHDPDKRVPQRYGVGTMPTSWIIDHRGIVRHITAGYRARDAREMERVVVRLLDALPSARADREPTEPAGHHDGAEETEPGEDESIDDESIDDEPATADETDPAAPADEPPAASRSEAGRSGGLCSAGGTPVSYPEALLLGFAALMLRRRSAR